MNYGLDFKRLMPMWLRYQLADLRGRGVYSNFADEYKCIFIHIPKTAGTSIAKTLFGKGSRHVPYFEYEKANKNKFRKYFKFAFVRNPWERLVSSFFFLKRGGLNEMDRTWADGHLVPYDDFGEFVRKWLSEENIWSWIHFIPQYYFICDENFKIKVDFVGHMETIEKDFAYVAQRIGCSRHLEKLNAVQRRRYSDYYTEETWDIVAKVYQKDIQLFGYSFIYPKNRCRN